MDLNIRSGFGVIQNNTALKRSARHLLSLECFGVIQNNTALKHSDILK